MSIRMVAASVLAVGMMAAGPALAASQTPPPAQPPAGSSCACPHAGMGHGPGGSGMGAQAQGTCPHCPMAQGGTKAGMACPCAQMRQMANVTVQNTPQGATITLNAKDPSQAAQVQQMATRMQQCLSGAAQPGPQAPAKK